MRKQSKSSLPPAFQRLAWSNLAAQLAEQIGLAAAPLVAVLTLGAGEAATGVLQTGQTLPFLLFSIPAGVRADRMPRARLMSRAEVLRVVSLLVILALVTLGELNLLLLAVLGFIGACGTVAFSVAAPALVESDALPVANGRIELARTTAFAAGPALGGALVGWIGGGLAFAVAALLSASAVILLAGINEPNASIGSPRHPLVEVREGAAFVLRHPLLRPIFLTQFIFNTALFVIQAIYVPYATHTLQLPQPAWA
jgi:MFS family permease